MLYLETLCQKFNVQAIAEEMSEEALSDWDCTSSIPKKLASKLKIHHRYCDPNTEERKELNILAENQIRLQATFPTISLSESEIQARIADSYAKREQYWLEQLCDLDIWPVLFVCGANHVKTFSGLSDSKDINVHVAAEDWEPNPEDQSRG